MKKLIETYKAELLIALGAISGIVASLATHEGAEASIYAVTIAIIAIVINALKEGISDATVTLIAQAIKIIVEELGKPSHEEVVAAAKELTIEEIKERLVSNGK